MLYHDSTASSRRLAGRVNEHALFSVTIDVLMKCSQSFRANGSDQEKIGRREGVKPWALKKETPMRSKTPTLDSLMDEFLGVLR